MLSSTIAPPAVQSELRADEQLLWSGQPRGGIRFRAADILLVPFSLMWGGFAIFWEFMVLSTLLGGPGGPGGPGGGVPWFFAVWGIPFVLIGLYLIVGRFFADAALRARTYYAVTDSRLLIIHDFFGRRVQTLPLHSLPEITLQLKGDGSGSLVFGGHSLFPFGSDWGAWPGARRAAPPAFEMIENARQVFDIIQDAQQRARQPS